MSTKVKSNGPQRAGDMAGRILMAAILGLGTAAVIGLLVFRKHAHPPVAEASATPDAAAMAEPAAVAPRAETTRAAPAPVSPAPDSAEAKPITAPTRPAVAATAESSPPQPARPVASAESRQLVEALSRINPGGAPFSGEQALAWKQNLRSIVQLGAAGVPAIREFLEQNKDFVFGSANAELLGYDSVRAALFDALRQIGGPEGTQGILDALRSTGDPREVLTLARNLELMAPGEHRQEYLDSARQVLGMATRGELKGYDVGPLFEVLQKYGGADVLADLGQSMGQWKYYSAIGLANLPEGAGIPSLIQLASGTSGNRGLALEMLAQVSLQYPDARAALLDQVRGGKIPPNQWPYLSSVLGGDYYQLPEALWYAAQGGAQIDRQKTAHIGYGNQNFYQGPLPGGGSAELVSQQMALVDEITAATSDANAVQALQNAKAALNRRLARFTAAAPAANP